MTPESNTNLDQFLASFQMVGAFFLGVGVVDMRSLEPPEPMRRGCVLKRHINVREAWQIGVNDFDVPGVLSDDDVHIPPGHEMDAPVLALLNWKREQKRGREGGRRDGRSATKIRSKRRAKKNSLRRRR
jgi:hypothetical protein